MCKNTIIYINYVVNSSQSRTPMNQMLKVSTAPASDAAGSEVLPLTDVFVPLDSIKPGGSVDSSFNYSSVIFL